MCCVHGWALTFSGRFDYLVSGEGFRMLRRDVATVLVCRDHFSISQHCAPCSCPNLRLQQTHSTLFTPSRIPALHPSSSCRPCRRHVSLHHLPISSVPSLFPPTTEEKTYPNSKCLHLLSANCAFVLHAVHSSLSTIFFVVLAFLWKTGFVWPP